MELSGFCKDGIYRSLGPPLNLPKDENLSMASFVFRNVSSYPDRLALADADTGERLSFQELKNKVNDIGSGLYQLGIRKGDVVIIVSPNSIYFPVCFLGVLSIGAVATTVNPQYTKHEIKKQVTDSDTKLIFTIPGLLDQVKDLGLPVILMGADSNSTVPNVGDYSIVVSRNSAPSMISFTNLLDLGRQKECPHVVIKQTDTAALLYSSGTTGVNKGVILTHRNFIACGFMAVSDQELRGKGPSTLLIFLPMFHAFGLASATLANLQRGNVVISMAKFSFVKMLEAIQEYKVSIAPIVPPIAIALAKEEVVKRYDLSSLDDIICGAAPLSKEVQERCIQRLPRVRVLQGYGLTESCGIAAKDLSTEKHGEVGSAGMLVVGMEAKIVDVESGKSQPPNKQGEIWLRGPNIMKGYWNNPEATNMALDKQGWLHTGDLGFFNDIGSLFIMDRIKELIKYKGFQIAPAELEGLLLSNPGIVDAGVIPLPNESAGEVPIAYVVRATGSYITEDQVKEHLAKQVAPFKRLHKVIFVNAIPKSLTGKILRRQLIEMTKSKL